MLRVGYRLIEVNLRPVAVVPCGRRMCSGNDGEYAAAVRERSFDLRSTGAQFGTEVTLPGVIVCPGVVKMPSPDPMRVGVLLPVPARTQCFIRVRTAIPGDAGASPTLERQRLHDID